MHARAALPRLPRRPPGALSARRQVASSSPAAAPAQATPPRQLYPFAGQEVHRSGVPAPAPLLAGTLPRPRRRQKQQHHGRQDDGCDNADDDENDDASHLVHFEVRGNPRGLPALVLHGGPGAGSYPSHSRFFDPARYCVILFDQRGCGRSAPLGRLRGNNAASLVRDAEALREHLGISEWAAVLGGSWGAALALEYGLRAPESVRSLVLRAVCTMRLREEVGWLYRGGGAATVRPEAWRAFLQHVGMTAEDVQAGREDPVAAYYERLLSEDVATRDAAASAWMAYEWAIYSTRAEDEESLRASSSSIAPPPPLPLPPALAARGLAFPGVCDGRDPATRADYTAAQALLLCHYSLHGGFVNGYGRDEELLLSRIARAAEEQQRPGARRRLLPLSCRAFHGAADAVCPPQNARDLQAAWPQARVEILAGPVGHSMYDPALVSAVVAATDAAADEADAEEAATPLLARNLDALIEEGRARREAEVAVAAAALTRA